MENISYTQESVARNFSWWEVKIGSEIGVAEGVASPNNVIFLSRGEVNP
jgi:hypothetical protein